MPPIDEFVWHALIAGVLVACITGPLGCHVVWRRMAYFGDTVAHSALLGVAIALAAGANAALGVFLTAVVVSVALILLQRQRSLPADTLLALLAHSSLAVGLVAVSVMPTVRVDLPTLLFGDILAVTTADLWTIGITAAAALALLGFNWRLLLATTVHEEMAQAEGHDPMRARMVFMLLMAATISVAIKVVGVLLLTSLLIIPAASARRLATSPEMMAFVAIGVGIASVCVGLWVSLLADTPTGPSIVVAALIVFIAVQFGPHGLLGNQARRGLRGSVR